MSWVPGEDLKLSYKPPEIKGDRPPDSLSTSTDYFIAGQHAVHLPPIDFSRVQHGAVPGEFIRDPADITPPTWQELQQKFFPRPPSE